MTEKVAPFGLWLFTSIRVSGSQIFQVYLGTSRSLMLKGGWNAILGTRLDSVEFADRRVVSKSLTVVEE